MGDDNLNVCGYADICILYVGKGALQMSNQENINVFEKEYIPSVIKIGRATNLIGVLMALVPAAVLAFVFKVVPPFPAFVTGFLMQASISTTFWIVEPLSYSPSLGIAGTYMSFLSGNIAPMRLPAALSAMEAGNEEAGTDKGAVLSTIGIAVSIVVNEVILTIGILLGAAVLQRIPANVLAVLNNIIPALYGTMLAQQVVKRPKVGAIAIAISIVMFTLSKVGALAFLPISPTAVILLTCVFGTILIVRGTMAPKAKEKAE